MAQDNKQKDLLEYGDDGSVKIPSGINVLTILTFIGTAIGVISSIWTFFSAASNYAKKDEMIEKMSSDSMPAWAKSLIGDPLKYAEMITKSYENRLPILICSLVAMALCFMGALQMRKLKKQGFVVYSIGELLPFLTQFLFIGAMSMSGVIFYCVVFISLLFIMLYFFQRKYLVNP